MKILHLSTSDVDNGGARAAYRLNEGLQLLGCDSQMLVRAKFSHERTVVAEKSLLTKLSPPISGLPLRFYPHQNSAMFSPQWFPDVLAKRATQINPDVINLHWICNGYLQIETLPKFNKPLVWTLHDMWPFTGGCNYIKDCQKFKESCGDCPQLQSGKSSDLSRWVWQRKAKAWKNLDLTIVTPSQWLADEAQKSSLLGDRPIHVIPNGINTKIYKPLDTKFARDLLYLPQDKYLILFGAMRATSDSRKGWQFLQPTLQRLKQSGWQDRIELVIFGASEPEAPENLEFPCHYLGQIHDDLSLSIMYAASDLLLVPSTQDNLPNTVMESISCGTPCVAFNIGGIPDMIDHQQNGYLATPFDCEDLANGIDWVLNDAARYKFLRLAARQKAEQEFDQSLQAQRYQALFNQILKN